MTQIFAAATIIFQLLGSKPCGSASGFFFQHNNELFLITNKHVVEGSNDLCSRIDTLKLVLHRSDSDLKQNIEYKIPLYKGKNKIWIEHKNANVDVVAIPLSLRHFLKNFYFKSFSKDNFLPSHYVLYPGEDLIVMGYPYGYYDRINNLPVFRTASIASILGIDFEGEPLFLTDGKLHPGISGSPIIAAPRQSWHTNNNSTGVGNDSNFYLIGVHSAVQNIELRFKDKLTNRITKKILPLELGVSWYAKTIIEILESKHD